MHVLLIHQAFAALDEPGGTRHHELARLLVERGHRVTILAGQVNYLTGESQPPEDRNAPASESSGVTILHTYTYAGWHKSFVHRTFSFLSFMISAFITGLRIREVDLIWGTSPPLFQSVTALALARMKRAVFILEIRDLWPEFAIAVGVLRNRLLIRLSEWLERLLYRSADRVVVNSPGFVPHVRTRGGERVEVVPNGTDVELFTREADGAAFRARYGLEDRFIVLYAGAHGLSNDLGVVLQAAELTSGREDIHFVLLGAGKDKPILVEAAGRKGLGNVTFASPVPKQEMPQALAAAGACLAILKPLEVYKTTFPNKVFDYMAASKPVLLAIDGAIRQVVETAGAGVFVPPGDAQALAGAVQRLADDPDVCRQMGLAGRGHVEAHFDRRKLAEQLEEVFMSALSARRSDASGLPETREGGGGPDAAVS